MATPQKDGRYQVHAVYASEPRSSRVLEFAKIEDCSEALYEAKYQRITRDEVFAIPVEVMRHGRKHIVLVTGTDDAIKVLQSENLKFSACGRLDSAANPTRGEWETVSFMSGTVCIQHRSGKTIQIGASTWGGDWVRQATASYLTNLLNGARNLIPHWKILLQVCSENNYHIRGAENEYVSDCVIYTDKDTKADLEALVAKNTL